MANIEWSAFPNGAEMQVGDITVGLRSALNYQFTFPSTGIKDVSGNYLLGWTAAGSAVNYVTVVSASTTNSPYITSSGSDTNPNLTLKTQGSGSILFTPGGSGNIQCSTHLILSTSLPLTDLEAASKGYVDSKIIATPVSLADGGTSASLVASNGGIFYSTDTAGAILSGTATANQVLLSGSSSAPSWSTATYPSTTSVSQLLYSSSNNTIAGLSTANNGVLVTSNSGVPSILAGSGMTGNVLQSNASAAPSFSAAIYPSTTTINQILYSSSNNNITGLSSAASSVLITNGSSVPSFSQTLPSAVQGNITTLGTITSGTWNASIITGQYGGTGVNNSGKTITLGGSLTTSGAFSSTFTMTNTTSVTFPTTGTLATTADLPTLPLSLANGGTNANLTAANGGIVYSNASMLAILAPTSTMNQILLSGSNTTPAWSTATYPATTTANQLLYSSSTNTIAGLATTPGGALVTDGTGVPSISATSNAGYVLTSNGTGSAPTWQGISDVLTWNTVSGTSQAASVNNGYILTNVLQTTVTLPATAAIGSVVALEGKGMGGWVVVANTGQTIQIGSYETASAGQLSTITGTDNAYITCVAANTTWRVRTTNSQGLLVDAGDNVNQVNVTLFSQTGTGSFVGNSQPFIVNPMIDGIAGGIGGDLAVIINPSSITNGIMAIALQNAPAGSNPSIFPSGTDTNRGLVINGKGTGGGIIKGTGTNDSAASGYVGEFVTNTQGSGVSLTSTAAITITSISLTAGDWDVWGEIVFNPAAATVVNYIAGSISLTDNAINTTTGNIDIQSYGGQIVANFIPAITSVCNAVRISISSTTTIYLVAVASFSLDTMTAVGIINARRAR